MKKAILGLVALVGAGCATAAHEMPRFETTVRANAEQTAEQAPLYSRDAPLPSETFSYDTGFGGESKEIITMDTHGFTIQYNDYTFIHTEIQPVHDVFYRNVVNRGCENLLVINNEGSSQRWRDTGCEGIVELYEEFNANSRLVARESPASNRNTILYGATFNLLLVEEVDRIWRARWNIPGRREVVHWWNYPYLE